LLLLAFSSSADDEDDADDVLRTPRFTILMVRVRSWPSRLKVMLMPTFRIGGATRRSLLLSALACLGHVFCFLACSGARVVSNGSNSPAIPVHSSRLAMNRRTASATSLLSMVRSAACPTFSR